jgi:hypothetical protein
MDFTDTSEETLWLNSRDYLLLENSQFSYCLINGFHILIQFPG